VEKLSAGTVNIARLNPGQSTFTALAFDVPIDAVAARLDVQNAFDEPVVVIEPTGATS